MDFRYDEEQQAIFDLAAQILSEGSPAERLLALERGDGPRFDPDLWARVGEAGLVGVAVPSAYDGGGLSFLEAFRLLMEVMGQRGYLRPDGKADELIADGMVETLYRSLLILTFGGGTNEIQRDLIGLFGLGLPRIPRM